MSILVYWRYDNYLADTADGTAFDFNFNSNQPRLHDATEIGEDLFAITGVRVGERLDYCLAAHLVIAEKLLNPPDYRYGRYRVLGDKTTSRYFEVGVQALTPLLAEMDSIQHFPPEEVHKYAQAFQTIRKLSEHDAALLRRFAQGLLAHGEPTTGRVFGHIPGYLEGSEFASRAELAAAGVHRPTQAGISGSAREGADSIVLSGGYEDDRDEGDEIIYTGHGGRDPASGRQVADQTLTAQNLALARNKALGLPVRVVRGGRHRSPHSPATGYRYDGLYRVDDYWRESGQAGYKVWRYRLVKLQDGDAGAPPEVSSPSRGGTGPATRRQSTLLRIVRDTRQAKAIKVLYDYSCQVCGTRLEGSAGPYAEAAHIRPLGAPHDGPDTTDNLLCLCPNHHVLFDMGGFAVADDLSLIGGPGRLRVHPKHRINPEHLRYHREHYT
jgi:putative restriction endonuclease